MKGKRSSIVLGTLVSDHRKGVHIFQCKTPARIFLLTMPWNRAMNHWLLKEAIMRCMIMMTKALV